MLTHYKSNVHNPNGEGHFGALSISKRVFRCIKYFAFTQGLMKGRTQRVWCRQLTLIQVWWLIPRLEPVTYKSHWDNFTVAPRHTAIPNFPKIIHKPNPKAKQQTKETRFDKLKKNRHMTHAMFNIAYFNISKYFLASRETDCFYFDYCLNILLISSSILFNHFV